MKYGNGERFVYPQHGPDLIRKPEKEVFQILNKMKYVKQLHRLYHGTSMSSDPMIMQHIIYHTKVGALRKFV